MSDRKLTPSEKRGWARVVRSVRPLGGVTAPTSDEGKPEPSTQTVANDRKQALRAPRIPSQPEEPKRPASSAGLRDRERKVRRGQVEIDARFDLHGLTQAEAEMRLPGFLIGQRRQGARCVLVITGKGRSGEGVLRRNFLDWLTSGRASEHVSGYAPAHPRHGGGGAFYVFLRRL